MSQRFGTFAVNDHGHELAFVADVLLYDRLVIPYPACDEAEETRWHHERWEPDRLYSRLAILGDLAVRVPWTDGRVQAWRALYRAGREVGQGFTPFQATAAFLAKEFWEPHFCKDMDRLRERGLVAPDATVVAAYPSMVSFLADFQPREEAYRQYRRERLGWVLSHEFLVPTGEGRDADGILRDAVALARSPEFLAHRAKLNEWQDLVIRKGMTDEAAVEEMRAHLEAFNRLVKRAARRTVTKVAYTVAECALPFLGGLLALPELVIRAGESMAVIGDKFFFADHGQEPIPEEIAPAAIFHDVRRVLG